MTRGCRRRRSTFTATVLAIGLVATGIGYPTASAATSSATLTEPTGVTVAVHPDGSYLISKAAPLQVWSFGGTIAHPLTDVTVTGGHDSLGGYREIDFRYRATGDRRGGIRTYTGSPVVLFTTTYLTAAPNTEPFPSLTSYPKLPYHLSYQDAAFSPFQFNGADAPDSPRLYFDQAAHGFLLSPADDFQVADLTTNPDGSISDGIIAGVTRLPAGFTQRTVFALGNGINSTYRVWGAALLAQSGKAPASMGMDVTMAKLGYWTDNFATYYYNFDPSKGYVGTLQAVKDDFAAHGIPLGYLQLDSWWYPKGSSDTWQGNGTNRGGEYVYRAAPDLFSNGLAAFGQQIGLPLVTHARWIDTASPYHQQYRMSGNVITDPRFWSSTMDYLKSAGVVTYEQDWLSAGAQPEYNLTDPNAFLGGMASSAAADGIALQYCMPLPRDYLQSTLYPNLVTTRVSDDGFGRARWDEFLLDSRLASALGESPWSDVLMSTQTDSLVLSTLSGGMVGVGDPIGKENWTNLAQSVRPDGVIVKPDAAIVPDDQTYLGMAAATKPAMVAGTYSQHGTLRDGYVFAYARNGQPSQAITFSPAEFGVSGNAYVYDYFTGKGSLVPAGTNFTDTVGNSGSYYVIAPVGRSGIAFLGDAGKFVSVGAQRIAQLTDNGAVRATVAFAPGEGAVTLHGYAPTAPTATARNGAVGPVSYDPATHLFSVPVSAGHNGSTMITLTAR